MSRNLLILLTAVVITALIIVAFVPPGVPINPDAQADEPYVLFSNPEGGGFDVDGFPLVNTDQITVSVHKGISVITLKFMLSNAGLGSAEDVQFTTGSADGIWCVRTYMFRAIPCTPVGTQSITLMSGDRLAVTLTLELILPGPVTIQLIDENGNRVGPTTILITPTV